MEREIVTFESRNDMDTARSALQSVLETHKPETWLTKEEIIEFRDWQASARRAIKAFGESRMLSGLQQS